MTPEPGIISICGDDSLRLEIAGQRLFITKEDVKNLIFYGRAVPVSKSVCRTGSGGITESSISIEGHVSVSSRGRAVKIFTTAGDSILPFVSLQRVARGEAISAPLFPLDTEIGEGKK